MEPRKNSIKERSKKIPLDIRLYVAFVTEYYRMNYKGRKTNLSEKQEIKMHRWSEQMMLQTIKQIEKWKADGAELKSNKYKNGK